MVSVIKF